MVEKEKHKNKWIVEWIDIELTSFCNIHCYKCFREVSDYANKINNTTYISLDLIKERFKPENFPHLKDINFCGSVDEATSHPDFLNIIKYFSTWGVHINIATNGSLRKSEWWEKLAQALPKHHNVTFGIDGINGVSQIYRIGSKEDIVKKNYRAFIGAGGRATWQFIIFPHNEHQKELVKEIAKKEGFRKVKFIHSHRK